MKRFIIDCIGAIIIVALASLAIPLFTNYHARIEAEGWLSQIHSTQQAIARRAIAQGSLRESGHQITPPLFEGTRPDLLLVNDDGKIIMKGGYSGQLLLLVPVLEQGQVRWTCIGGTHDAVPEECRSIELAH